MTAAERYYLEVRWPHDGDESLAPLLSQVAAAGQIPESGR
jgi:hypothetical protein